MIRKPTQRPGYKFNPLRHNWEPVKNTPATVRYELVPYVKKQNKLRLAVIHGFGKTFDKVRQMCETLEFEGYSDEILCLGYNVGENIFSFKNRHPNDKIICYQLEQICGKSQWYDEDSGFPHVVGRTNNAKEWFSNSYEIWDYDLDNILFLQSKGFHNLRFMPMRYYEGIRTVPNLRKDFDILFFGSMNEKRRQHLDKLKNYRLKILDATNGLWGEELDNLIGRSKLVLNLHYYDSHLQEQVRLFPLVANDVCVLSEKSRYNYFGGLIQEFEGNDLVDKCSFLLTNDNWRHVSEGIGDKFKNRYYKVGAIYNTFYGLEQIQDSINSIRPIVDHIVIVHQRTGFHGETETPETAAIIAELEKKYPVIYLDTNQNIQDGVVFKRNLGLDYCRKAGCDFVIPLDTDEEYNCKELRKDLDYMFDNGIDTLYCPIETYYYDRSHYFPDNYYVPTAFRINDRNFDHKPTSVLCDPARRMEERKYMISKNPMRHYSYMYENYQQKAKNHVNMNTLGGSFVQAYNYMKNWKDGMCGLVFGNTNEGLKLVEKVLQKA